MKQSRRLQPGFTLVEVLVILAILAVIAGILVPQVLQQVSKSDATRVVGDISNIRTAAEAFLIDVKRYAGDIDDLATAPGATETDINANTYPSGLLAKWDGPYIDKAIADGGAIVTGFAGEIYDDFISQTYNGVSYLTVRIKGIAESDFNKIDETVDGSVGATAGRLRWFSGAGTAADSIHYYAIPIN